MADQIVKQLIARLAVENLEKTVNDIRAGREAVNSFKDALITLKKAFGATFKEGKEFLEDYIKTNTELESSLKHLNTAYKELSTSAKAAKAGADDFKDVGKSFTAEISLLEKSIQSVSMALGVSFKGATEIIRRSGITSDYKALGVALSNVTDKAKTAAAGFTGMFSSLDKSGNLARALGLDFTRLGKIFTGVFAGMVTFRIVRFFSDLVNKLKEATLAAQEFRKSQVQLIVSIRALQRSGVDTTLSEWNELISELQSTFTQFTQEEIVSGVQEIIVLGRQVGVSTQEMKQFVKAAATLATVTGTDLNTALDAFTDAIKSGRTSDRMRELVGAMEKTTLNAEAVSLGFARSSTEVTKYERFLTLLTLAQREAGAVSEDFLLVQNDVSGQIEETKNRIDNLKKAIGNEFLPVLLAWNKFLISIWEVLKNAAHGVRMLGWAIHVGFTVPLISAKAIWVSLVSGVKMSLSDMVNVFKEAFKQITLEYANFENVIGKNAPIGSRVGVETSTGGGEISSGVDISSEQKASDDLLSVWEQYREDRSKLERDLQKDLQDIARSGIYKRERLARQLSDKLADIVRRSQYDLQDAARKYQDDVTDENISFKQKLQDIEEKYKEDQLKRERDFQERLRRLREEFLFSLEDAIRARDAKQILRLIRRYNLDREQLLRRAKLEKKDRELRYKQEIQDAKRQHARRLRELRIAFIRRQQEIQRQRAISIREARISYARELEELRISLEEQRKERLLQYQQQRRDLELEAKRRLNTIMREYFQAAIAAGKGGKAIYDALNVYLGAGGGVEQIFRYYISLLRLIAVATNTTISGIIKSSSSLPTPSFSVPGYAEGGTLIVKKPTLALFGEVPEIVNFTPINRLGRDENKVFGGYLPSTPSKNPNQRLELLISLSPNLEHSIIENTLSEFSDILVSVERAR